MTTRSFQSELAEHIWQIKYRQQAKGEAFDKTLTETWQRVSHALASVETSDRKEWEQRFYEALDKFRFIPGGRILAGAGTDKFVTLMNCFVMGWIEDSIDGIFESLKEGALTMQQGGGIGYDFSSLRPKGARARSSGTVASGPVSFMKVWDSMCATLISTGTRRGAMMGTLRCDHPDIEEFIEAKRDPAALRHFNLSVQVSDDFLRAAKLREPWPLVFPSDAIDTDASRESVMRPWPGHADGETLRCSVVKTVNAGELWDKLIRATYDVAEPGVLFIDRINRCNNLWYRELIAATNPCGEVPLPSYGSCNLGSLNLTQFVRDPFTPQAKIDEAFLCQSVRTAVRMLDNVIDLSRFPLPAQKEQALGSRRIGIGITGLADMLIMLGIRYGSEESFQTAATTMQNICHNAYRSSIELAREKGSFPQFDMKKYLDGEFVKKLPAEIRDGIAKYGIRNSHLLAVAPAGTISLLAENVSSGIEPVYAFKQERRVIEPDGKSRTFQLNDFAWRRWRDVHGEESLPDTFVDAHQLSPLTHLKMEAVLQPYVDNAISKTINIPAEADFETFRAVYYKAYEMGLKGCTVFRPNPVTGEILRSTERMTPETGSCCPVI